MIDILHFKIWCMALDIGDSAPDFELTDPDMKMRTLGEFRGK